MGMVLAQRTFQQNSNAWLLRNDGSGVAPPKAVASYSGMAVDPTRKRIFIFGGGHNDYYGNDPWYFDVDTLTFVQIHPVDLPNGSPDYTTMRTWSGYDSFPYPGSIAPPPNSNPYHPVGRHTYNAVEYDPTIQKVFVGGHATYSDAEYNGVGEYLWLPASEYGAWHKNPGDLWTNDFSVWDWILANAGDGSKSRINNIVYNSTDGLLYICVGRADAPWSGYTHIYTFDASEGGSLTQVLDHTVIGGDVDIGAYYPAENAIYFLSNGTLRKFDCTTPGVSTVTGITGDSLPSGNGVGWTFDSRNQIFLAFGVAGLFAYDPARKICTELAPSNPPDAPAGDSIVYGMFKYDPTHNVSWYMAHGTSKLQAWSYRYL